MLALPPAPAPAPRRQLLLGTAFGGAAMAMFFGGMLAVWLRFRNAAPTKTSSNGDIIKDWVPKGVAIHDVAANLMLITLVIACVMAQMAVYSAKRDDKVHVGLGLGITGVMGLAVLNAQAFEYGQMAIPISGGIYNSMFYAITGAWVVLLIVLLVATAVTAFRYLGGRTQDREVVSALALFWYVSTAVYVAVWFVVYVTK